MGLKDYKPTPPDQVGVAQTSSERLVDVDALMPVVEEEEEVEVEAPSEEVEDADEVLESLEGNVISILEFAKANPDSVESLLANEQKGKSRKKLVAELKALLGDE